MRIIDLTHKIYNGMPKIPSEKHTVTKIKKISDIEKDGIERHEITLSCHSGTHIDAPRHLIKGKTTIDKIKIEKFIGNAIKINLLSLNPKKISRKEVKNYDYRDVDFVVFQTGWERKWNTNRYYFNYPYLSDEVAEFLIRNKIRGICIDFPSVDKSIISNNEMHKKLLRSNIIIVENVCNLNKLPEKGFKIIALPLLFKGLEASPARVCAIID